MGNLLEMRECYSLLKTVSEGATVFSIKQPIAACVGAGAAWRRRAPGGAAERKVDLFFYR